MRSIIRIIIEALKRFFSSKAGKRVAGAAAVIGVGAAADGAVKVVKAKKTNKLAKLIEDHAKQRYEDYRSKAENALKELGDRELVTMETFDDFAAAIEKIQDRPVFHSHLSGIQLPEYSPAEYMKLSATVELLVGGAGGVAAGAAVGVAAMGAGVLALGPAALAGGVVICAMGAKMKRQSAENLRQAKKMRQTVDEIVEYLDKLCTAANKLRKVIEPVFTQYQKHLKKLQKIVAKKNDWDDFSAKEQLITENTVMLASLLFEMCHTQLQKKSSNENTIDSVDTQRVEELASCADEALAEVKRSA